MLKTPEAIETAPKEEGGGEGEVEQVAEIELS